MVEHLYKTLGLKSTATLIEIKKACSTTRQFVLESTIANFFFLCV